VKKVGKNIKVLPGLRSNSSDKVREDGEQFEKILRDVTGGGVMVHKVEDVERVVDEGESVIADGEQFVLDSVDEDSEDGDESGPGGMTVQDGEIQLKSRGSATDKIRFLI
jgi:hypothetical protein